MPDKVFIVIRSHYHEDIAVHAFSTMIGAQAYINTRDDAKTEGVHYFIAMVPFG
jgi:hypothetical protein